MDGFPYSKVTVTIDDFYPYKMFKYVFFIVRFRTTHVHIRTH